MELVIFSILNGIVFGLLLFMMSSGLTLIFSMMGVLNFAHASFFMLGAYFAYQVSALIGFWPALIVAPVLVGVVGALVERYGLRPVHRFGHVAELLFTFGIAFVIAAPLAYFAVEAMLQDFVYRIDISVWIFLMAGLAALGIAWLTVSYHAVKAALADPVEALRYE